jgi:addiction module HigA family antidote
MRELTTEEKELVELNKARGVKYGKTRTPKAEKKYRRLPGHVLVEEFLVPYYPADLSDLASRTGIAGKRLHKLVRGQDRIDNDMAERLGKFFRNGANYWLSLQERFESGEQL